MIYSGKLYFHRRKNQMKNKKVKAAVVIVGIAVLVPVINYIYGFMPAALSGIIMLLAAIALAVSIVRRPKGNGAASEICSDITDIAINICGGNYIVSRGDGFSIDDHSMCNIISYVENGVWNIKDNPENEGMPVDITVPRRNRIKGFKVNIDKGNLFVSSLNVIDADIRARSGRAEIKGLRAYSIWAEAGSGNIVMEADAEKLNLSCGSGYIDVALAGSIHDYEREINVGVGSARVGNNVYGKENRVDAANIGAPRKIRLSCGMGKIEVDFKEEGNDE